MLHLCHSLTALCQRCHLCALRITERDAESRAENTEARDLWLSGGMMSAHSVVSGNTWVSTSDDAIAELVASQLDENLGAVCAARPARGDRCGQIMRLPVHPMMGGFVYKPPARERFALNL